MDKERINQINWSRERLEKSALQYARVKCFGVTLENDGSRVTYCNSEIANLMKYYTEQMQYEAQALLVLLEAPPPERKK